MAAAAKAEARNPGIDLLRGLSIVLVVMHHVGLRIPLRHGALSALLPAWSLNALIYNGYEAVFIFFVISGFLITTNTQMRWGGLDAIDPRAFYSRRAARILPCLLVLVAVLSGLHLLGAQDYHITKAGQSLPRAIGSALGFHLNWYEGRTGYLPGNWDVLWSLSIEEVFYLGFPILCLALGRRKALGPALALLALSLPVSRAALAGNEIWQEKAYLPGMAGIAMGVLAALVAGKLRPARRGTLAALAVLGAAGVAVVLCGEGWLWPLLGNGCILLLTLSTAILLVALHGQAREGRPWRFPGTAWLRSFGRLSYEIYLTHMFIVWPVVRAFRARGGGLWWGILWYLPALALSWFLGWLVARGLSLPAERWMRRILGKTPPEPPAPEALPEAAL
ncbi:MAG TPA: acyltransferase [Holophagaceae bacterium]|nr:acyltransferase [Holophagaceae bacterium]